MKEKGERRMRNEVEQRRERREKKGEKEKTLLEICCRISDNIAPGLNGVPNGIFKLVVKSMGHGSTRADTVG